MFDKINIADCLVIIGLVSALVLAIFYGMNELAMSLLGYIGGNIKTAASTKGDSKNEGLH